MTRAMRRITRTCAGLVLALSVTVLAGYALALPSLVSLLPKLQGMSSLTAVGLAALAIGLLAEDSHAPRVAVAACGVALALGVGLLLVYAVEGSDEVGPFLAAHVFGYHASASGRTSPATAACLCVLGVAGLTRHRPRVADGAAFAATIVSGAGVLGYAYGISDLYAVPVFRTMALHTAISLLLLSLASMLVRPGHGVAAVIGADETGATRRQLSFVLFPPLVGWVLLQAVASGWLGPGAAIAFLVALTIAPLAWLIIRDGDAQAGLDRERRARAQILVKAAEEMTARLAEQAAALHHEGEERMNAEAVVSRTQKLEAVGQLTGGIAHDFNNLLMVISGNLQFMDKRLPADHPCRRYVDRATVATERGAKLTAQLLAFSRTQRLNIRPVELDLVLLQTRELLGNALGPGIDVEMRLGSPGLWVTTDPDQLDLAIINLAINARDAMNGSGRMTIASEIERTAIDAGADLADYIVVRLVDEGEGMSPEVLARATEPFFTTKERGKGTGLGLAQAHGFARQCRGDLRIASVAGVGTTIEILLPCTARPASGTVEARPMPTLPGVLPVASERRTVLVIDDDDGVRTVMVDALRGAGFDVLEARNGAEGLATLDAINPAAAIIDFVMPGMNGAEVARRAQLRRPGLPIVFVSGYFDTVALDGIAGAVVLRKPFDIEGLHRSVSSVLE